MRIHTHDRDVSCGDDHSLLSLSDGSVYVWGRGTQGALGLGSQVCRMCEYTYDVGV